MPIDDGVNWEGRASDKDAANVEVEAASTPKTGLIRVQIESGDEPANLAIRTAAEWNTRQPIEDVHAVAGVGSGLVRFLHPGGEILGVAVTFDGKPRMPLGVGEQESSQDNSVRLRRVKVQVEEPAHPQA